MNLFKTILFLALVFFINTNSIWAKDIDEVADAVLITKLDEFITLKPTLPRKGSQLYAYIASGVKFEYYFGDGVKDAMKIKFQNIFKESNRANATILFNPFHQRLVLV